MDVKVLALRTDPRLLARLEHEEPTKPSAAQMFEQRVSFVLGSMAEDSGVTRDQVRKVIEEQVGR